MVVAHGLLLMPTDVNTYEAGDRVKVQLLSTAFLERATR
jgi:molybdopterin biosynthesis enzyme